MAGIIKCNSNDNPVKIRGFSSLIFLTLIFVSTVVSCATLSPVSSVREFPPKVTGINAVQPDWQSWASGPPAAEETPGVFYFAGRIQSPRMEFRALKIDLSAPGLRIVVGAGLPSEAEAGVVGSARSTWVSSFVRRNKLLAGINTNPFAPVSGREGEERTIIGIAVSDGRLLSRPSGPYDALVFYTDGRAAILSQAELLSQANTELIYNAAGGFGIVLRQGELPQGLLSGGELRSVTSAASPAAAMPDRNLPEQGLARQDLPRHPRSAAGLSADGRTLYLLVIDGRRPGSAGATEAEIGLLLKQLGAWEGLNFDGGGSSSLALRYPDGKVRPVNIPIHLHIPGNERGVATCLGIGID